MALREFVDLGPANLALAQAAERQVDPLTALIQGFQLPQQIKQEALNQQLSTAINQAKLRELQQGKIFEVGNSLLQVDPTTGSVRSIFTAPRATATSRPINVPGVGLVVEDPTSPSGFRTAVPSGEQPLALQFKDTGDAVVGLHPLTGVEVSRTPKVAGKGVRPSAQGLFEYDVDNPSQGKIIPGTGPLPGTKPPKPLTEMQARANVSAKQAQNAESKLKNLEDVDPSWFVPGVPFFDFPERAKSAERKQFEQAAEEFTEAALRFKTGAAITKDETRRSIGIWIRQPGDDAITIANKKASRELLIKEMAEASGKPLSAPEAPKKKDSLGLFD